MMDKDIMIRFHHRVRELDRNYEKLNNTDFDNGVYHKYAYKQKKGNQKGNEEQIIKEEEIRQSDVLMNNLVSPNQFKSSETFNNYYVKINDRII